MEKELKQLKDAKPIKDTKLAKDTKPPSAFWSMVKTSILGRAINRLAGPFVDSQVMVAIHEYFPKARLIPHARTDVFHIETRLSHVTRKFAHVTFSVILRDPQIDELCMGLELGGYKVLIFGFTFHKIVWFPRSSDFYILTIEEWQNYRYCLDNQEMNSVLIPEVDPSLPIE